MKYISLFASHWQKAAILVVGIFISRNRDIRDFLDPESSSISFVEFG